MLYKKEYISDSTLVGIWKLEESKEELLSYLSDKVYKDIEGIQSEIRVLEKLAVRVLIKVLLGEEKAIWYNSSGKPFLADASNHISISHTRGYVAVAINNEAPIGLDIEQISEKVKRVKERLISEHEYVSDCDELTHLLLHWSAKEAMFKFLDTEGVDFRKHLLIEHFTPQREGIFQAEEKRTRLNYHFNVHYSVDEEFVLVCLEQRHT